MNPKKDTTVQSQCPKIVVARFVSIFLELYIYIPSSFMESQELVRNPRLDDFGKYPISVD